MLEEIIELVKGQLDCSAIKVTEATRFKEDLAADSLDLFELAMAAEEEFGVEIPSEAFASMKTVGDVADYIASHK